MRKKILMGSLLVLNLGLGAFTYPGEGEALPKNCCKVDTAGQNFCCWGCCTWFYNRCGSNSDCNE